MIRLLARLTGSVPPGEGAGLAVSSHEYWLLTKQGSFDLYEFIRRAPELFGEGATLYMEGTSMAPMVRDFLASRPAEDKLEMMTVTYWPKSRKYHVPVTRENMDALAEIADHCAEPEVCDHLSVYRDGGVMLEWWDTPNGAIIVDPRWTEAEVAEFCRAMNCTFERVGD